MTQVSIIIPCYNEQATIRLLLEALKGQSFPSSEIEVIIADGLSNDQTRAKIEEWCQENPEIFVRVVDNPKQIIPAALNVALKVAQGEVIIRLDAHSIPEPDYVERSVRALREQRGDNVGGIWQIEPGADGWVAQSIAVAASHPLGVGGAQYRVGGKAQAVDTVPFGAFHRDLVARIGFFDETLLSNEDYEYNARIRKAGGVVWFDPAIRSRYFARSTFRDLARQYWRYGFWKVQMLRRYPETIRWRQSLPPIFVSSLIVLGILSIWFDWARGLLSTELFFYGFILGTFGIYSAIKKRSFYLAIGFPVAIGLMHVAWGTAFLWSITKTLMGKVD